MQRPTSVSMATTKKPRQARERPMLVVLSMLPLLEVMTMMHGMEPESSVGLGVPVVLGGGGLGGLGFGGEEMGMGVEERNEHEVYTREKEFNFPVIRVVIS